VAHGLGAVSGCEIYPIRRLSIDVEDAVMQHSILSA
jgi:hypothetical protein